jgi:hypothetical protein
MQRYTPSRAHRIAEHPSRFIDCRHLAEGAERQVVASAALTRDPSTRASDRPLLVPQPVGRVPENGVAGFATPL